MLSATYFQHASTAQARGGVQSPLLFLSLASETQRKISFLDLRGQAAQKSAALSSNYVPTFGRHGRREQLREVTPET